MSCKLQALHHYIVVRPIKRKLSTIILVDTTEKINEGEVLSVGRQVQEVVVGDYVKFGNPNSASKAHFNFTKISADLREEQLLLISEKDVTGVKIKATPKQFPFKALRTNLIVQLIPEKEKDGIFLMHDKVVNDGAFDDRVRYGKVMSAGKKVHGVEAAEFIYFREGQPMMFNVDEIKKDTQTFLAIRQEDIYLVD